MVQYPKTRHPDLKFSKQLVAIMRKVYTALGLRKEGVDGLSYAYRRRVLVRARCNANSSSSSRGD